MYVRFAANSGRSHDLGRWFQFAPSAALGYSPIVTLEICGGRVEVSAPLQTRVGVATEFVVTGDLIGSGEAQEDGIVDETTNLAAPHGSMPRRSNSASIASKDEFGRHHCKGCPEDDRSLHRRLPNGEIYLHQFLPILAHIIPPHLVHTSRL